MKIINFTIIFLIRYIRFFLTSYPFIYFPVIKIFNRNVFRLVSNKTDIVIEGYPRSGNTFLESMIYLRANRNIVIAHHTHVIAQIKRSLNLNKPILVTIRNPIDAISSLFNFYEKKIPIEILLSEYYKYYLFISRSIEKILIINFDHINDHENLTKKIIKKFKLDLNLNINVDNHSIFENIGKIGKIRHNINYQEKYLTKDNKLDKNKNLKIKKIIIDNYSHKNIYKKCQNIYLFLINQIEQ